MKKIHGVQFILNGIKYDYCFKESIQSMLDACDQVHVLDAGSDDGTQDVLMEMAKANDKLFIYLLSDQELWHSIKGPTKLSYFQNFVMDKAEQAGADYIFLLQADEVLHEDSIPNLRAAAEISKADAFVALRYNLFKDPFHFLNVEQSRKPCSTEVIRLAPAYRRSYSDGEHTQSPTVAVYKGDLTLIEIFHFGFVRDPVKMVPKVRHMLTEVFRMDMDTRVDADKFRWEKFFKEEDLMPIPKPLPKYVKQWVEERYPFQ